MPTTCGITFVLVLALSAANTLLVPQPAGTESGPAPFVAGFITGIIQPFVIAPLEELTYLVTEESASVEQLDDFRAAGVEMVLA